MDYPNLLKLSLLSSSNFSAFTESTLMSGENSPLMIFHCHQTSSLYSLQTTLVFLFFLFVFVFCSNSDPKHLLQTVNYHELNSVVNWINANKVSYWLKTKYVILKIHDIYFLNSWSMIYQLTGNELPYIPAKIADSFLILHMCRIGNVMSKASSKSNNWTSIETKLNYQWRVNHWLILTTVIWNIYILYYVLE